MSYTLSSTKLMIQLEIVPRFDLFILNILINEQDNFTYAFLQKLYKLY